MISAVGSNNPLQMINALNAFKKETHKTESNFKDIDTSNGINLSDNDYLLKNIDVSDVRNCAKTIGEMNLTDDDIKYGLTYGRSVIADYVA